MAKLAALSQFIKNKSTSISKSLFVLTTLGSIGFVYLLINSFVGENNQISHVNSTIPANACVYQKINSICSDRKFDFAGEDLPVYDIDVKERLDREVLINTYWQSNTLLSLKLADKYFPIIEPILKQQNIPDDFKYLALIESGLRDVVSPAGAAGKWQIMKETGKNYGLEINDDVDERYHLEKATYIACRYFQQAYDTFGSWTAAAASFNIGIAGLKNRLKEQKVTNFYDLWLNSETSRYVFRIVAMKEVYKYPKAFGYYYEKSESYKPEEYEMATIFEPTDLIEYAACYNMKYKELRALNPWLRSYKLPNKNGRLYDLKIKKRAE